MLVNQQFDEFTSLEVFSLLLGAIWVLVNQHSVIFQLCHVGQPTWEDIKNPAIKSYYSGNLVFSRLLWTMLVNQQDHKSRPVLVDQHFKPVCLKRAVLVDQHLF
jgi:hypothetical protein